MWFGLLGPFLGTTVGAGAVLGVPMGSRRWNAALAGAAGGAMIAACVWNLLLPALEAGRGWALLGFAAGMTALLLPGGCRGGRFRLQPASCWRWSFIISRREWRWVRGRARA